MGRTYAEITLANSSDNVLALQGRIPKEEVKQLTVKALVDTGADTLIINEKVKRQLDLPVHEKKKAKLADGSIVECEMVGPVDVSFKTRSTSCRALVVPGDGEVLLGAIPIEDMDVLIDLKNNIMTLPPDRPDVAQVRI
jgi:clan AA aspartic protease